MCPQADSPGNITSSSGTASSNDFSLDKTDRTLLPPSLSDESESDEEDDRDVSSLPPRPMYHHYSKSHTYIGPSAFAPPFYNRPPTPLPPSPSLTSLLRPPFSRHSSRPTTPDQSSDEGTSRDDTTSLQTPNSASASTLTSTFRAAKTVPRASPRVPTYEYYGFTLYLTSSLAFIVYILWSYLPSPLLHQLGIYYYPNRWWALAVPAWTVMLVAYGYIALASYNTGYLTLPMESVECIVDEAANVAVIDANGKLVAPHRPSWIKKGAAGRSHDKGGTVKQKSGRTQAGRPRQKSIGKSHVFSQDNDLDWQTLWNEGTDAVMDIPIGGVCEILYGTYGTETIYA